MNILVLPAHFIPSSVVFTLPCDAASAGAAEVIAADYRFSADADSRAKNLDTVIDRGGVAIGSAIR